MPTRLRLFGTPRIERGTEPLVLPFERRNQLLVYLALKRSWVGRAELATMFWPEHESKLAYANLRKILFRLQSVPWATIESEGGAVRFEAQTDVSDFESALREERISDALFLRSGELLAGFEDGANDAWSSWLSFERNRLRTAWRSTALKRLADGIEADEAIELCSQLLEADPLDEEALRAQMTWLARSGQGARARQVYREFGERLAADLGIEPGTGLQALHDSLATVSAPQFAAPEPTARPDGFVGRSTELRRIAALLAQDGCRLLSLIGPGGVGKTRLAQRALRELALGYPDGAVFVPLEDLVLTSEIGGRLAREIGIALQGNREPLDQAIEFLRERRMLLVLDNFEQLTPGAAILEKLLQASPGLRIIVTSRVRLAVASEWLLPIEGLPCPEAEDLDRIEAFDAARLFIRAAHRANPALVPANDAPAIAEICRQVGGLPLALELAAAWTRVLSCAEIAAELQHGTELLQAVDDAQPERHASIEIVFNQSWRLLGRVERDALAKLSVFRGGFSAEAARAVAGASLPVLGALADKSLLHKDESRLYLHPLVQQLAQAKLQSSDDAVKTSAAHARHFLRGLAEARHRVSHADTDALREVDADFENIRAAWRYAVRHGPAGEVMRASYSLMSYCDHRGRRLDGLELMQEAIAVGSTEDSAKFIAALAPPAAWLAYRLDRYAEAEALGRRALDSSHSGGRGSGDAMQEYQAATVLGAACLRLGRTDDARRWLQRALDRAKKGGSPTNVASALVNLGLIARGLGELEEALRLYREALLRHREVGDAGGEASCLNNLGVVHIQRGEPEAASEVLRAARQLCDRHGLPSTRCMIEVNLANLAMGAGAIDQAASHARRALEISEQTGQRANGIDARYVLARAALHLGDLATARLELAEALTAAIAIGRRESLVHGAWLLAEILAAQDAPDAAARVVAFALQQRSSLVARERAEAERQLTDWSAVSGPPGEWTGPTLEELAHQIVAETPLAYAPLIAALRGAR